MESFSVNEQKPWNIWKRSHCCGSKRRGSAVRLGLMGVGRNDGLPS
jgi:hypothetical protein